jgi:nitrate/nitrite transporter NarK
MNSVGSVGASLSMFIIAFHPPAATSAATAVLTLGYFFFRFSFSGYWANMVDIAHAHAGSVMGISNTIATVPGMIGNTLTGLILDETGQWGLVFFLAGAAYVLAGVSFWLLADDVDIGDADVKHRKHKLEMDKQSDEAQDEDATDDEAEDGGVGRAINVNAVYR